jgi:hypothetical protein
MKSEKSEKYYFSSAMKSCHRTARNRWRFHCVTNKMCDESTIMSRDSDATTMPLQCDEPSVSRDVTVPSLLPRVIDLSEKQQQHRRKWPKLCQKGKLSENGKRSKRIRTGWLFSCCHYNNIYILLLLLLSVFVTPGICNSPPRYAKSIVMGQL